MLAGLAAASLLLSGCLYSLIPERGADRDDEPDSRHRGRLGRAAAVLRADARLDDLQRRLRVHDRARAARLGRTRAPATSSSRSSASRADERPAHRVPAHQPRRAGRERSSNFVRDSLTFAVGEDVVAAYDVIGFDPRGVGESTAVSCCDAADMDDYLFDIPQDPRGSDAWTEELIADAPRVRRRVRGEQRRHPALHHHRERGARHRSAPRRARRPRTELPRLLVRHLPRRDLREAVSPSASAGSSSTARSIPRCRGLDVSTTQALGFESALRAYMADCLKGDDCPFRGTVDEALDDLGVLLASVDRTPLTGSDGRMLGADTLMTGDHRGALRGGELAVPHARAHGRARGQPRDRVPPRRLLLRPRGRRVPRQPDRGVPRLQLHGLPAGRHPGAEGGVRRDHRREVRRPSRPYWSGPDPCDVWPYPATGVREKITADGAAPIVVVGTTNDPATPYEWAVSLADQLSSGVLVTRVGEGHTGYNKGNDCVDDAVEGYLLEGHRARGRPSLRVAMPGRPRPVRERSRDPVRSLIVHRASEARHLSSVGRAIHS